MPRVNVTALERAFELARSGSFRNLSEVEVVLRNEGYHHDQLQGPLLRRQLRALMLAAQTPREPDQPARDPASR